MTNSKKKPNDVETQNMEDMAGTWTAEYDHIKAVVDAFPGSRDDLEEFLREYLGLED
jgi:hypothetical protein